MRIDDVETGRWFTAKKSGGYFMKMDPCLRGTSTFQAVSLATGEPAFPYPTGSASPRHLVEVEVELIDKPDEMTEVSGQLRFDTPARRDAVEREIRDTMQFKHLTPENKPGAYFLHYTATADTSRRLRQSYGG